MASDGETFELDEVRACRESPDRGDGGGDKVRGWKRLAGLGQPYQLTCWGVLHYLLE
jgi:hypothetical protein